MSVQMSERALNLVDKFPCTLTIYLPFPTHRLAKAAIRTLSVDNELSSLVQRSFSLVADDAGQDPKTTPVDTHSLAALELSDDKKTVLKTDYKATTNRMLRVAVNGFFDSVRLVTQVMEELDTDVLHEKGLEDLTSVQGLEQESEAIAVGSA